MGLTRFKQTRIKQLYPGAWLKHTQFTLVAFTLTVLSVTSVLLPAQPVRAQEATVLEEIVVTARKRAESLQETPVVVNVLTEDVIIANRIEGVEDLTSIVPGLVISRTSSSSPGAIYLRGVGTGAGNSMFDQAVAINLDGVGISSPQLMAAGMFDLQQIEVMRGPQALFYGKNSPGGVIALHTKDPTDEFEFELSTMYEIEGEEPSVRAVISGPLGETLSGRLTASWSNAGNNLFDIYNSDEFETGPGGEPVQVAFATDKDPVEIKAVYVMGTLLWEPTDRFSAKLKFARVEHEQDGNAIANTQRTRCPTGQTQTTYHVPGFDNCKKDGKVIVSGLNPALVAAGSLYQDHRDSVGGFNHDGVDFGVLELNYDMGNDVSLTSVTGYFDTSIERMAENSWQQASGVLSTGFHYIEQWSQELRLSSNFAGPVNFTLGAFYEDKEISNAQDVVLGSNIAGLPISTFGVFAIPRGAQFNTQDSVAYSVFAELHWDLSEKWKLSAGARYSYEEKEIGMSAEVLTSVPRTDILVLDDKPDWDNLSPELTLSYQLSDDVMLFASYKTAFKSGGHDASYAAIAHLGRTAAGTAYDTIYDEEEVDGFEVGMKSTLLDGTLRLNAAAYSYKYDNMQLSLLTSTAGGTPSLKVINGGAASLDGVELETVWLTPADGLTLTANLAWADSQYDEYIAQCFTGQTIAMGCDQNLNPATGRFTGADMSGESLQNAAEWNASFGVNYTVAVGSNWNMAFNITSLYRDDYNATALMFPDDYRQESYWWTNAAVRLFSSDDKWELSVRGINLGSEYYAAQGSNAFPGGNGALTGTNVSGGLRDFYQYVFGGRQVVLGITYRQ